MGLCMPCTKRVWRSPIRGWIGVEEGTSESETERMSPVTHTVPTASTQPVAFPLPQAASTPAVNPSKRPTPVASCVTQASVKTPIQTTTHKEIRWEVIELSSVSSMGKEEIIMMTPEIRDKINEKNRLVVQKLEMLFTNWRAESNLAAGGPQHVLTSIDAFYWSNTQIYMRKREKLQWYIHYEDEMYGIGAPEVSREDRICHHW